MTIPEKLIASLKPKTEEPMIEHDMIEHKLDPNVCVVDGKPIVLMAFKGTHVCCEYCRKVRDGEIKDARTDA